MMQKFLAQTDLQGLLDALGGEGYSLIGPQVRDGAFVYEELTDVSQLPTGWQDDQSPGRYRLNKTTSTRHFAWANGPQAIKPMSFASREILWYSTREQDGQLLFRPSLPQTKPTAIIGIRACDLAALALQDQHFLQQEFQDPYYERRREQLFLVAVNCSHPAQTCFCHSTGDGPTSSAGYDIALTELEDGYLICSGSLRGRLLLDELPCIGASKAQLQEAKQQQQSAIETQKRALPRGDVSQMLALRQEHPHWDDIAERCLACGNCTAVCPSCFCHREIDESALGSNETAHIREWDSCFGLDHSYTHGLTVRKETGLRYRQWLTHKFSSWVEQYGRSGCTGCGRCISWCPTGIDVTQELRVLCASEDEK